MITQVNRNRSSARRAPSKLEILRAELKACDDFDRAFVASSCPKYGEMMAYFYRQHRRQEILLALKQGEGDQYGS
jgi:hypothetical protein